MPCRNRQHNSCRLLIFLVMSALIAFTFFVYYYAHLHVSPNGRILVHSHALPKSSQNDGNHSHSNLDLLVLDQSSHVKTIVFATFLLYFCSIVMALLLPSISNISKQTFYALFTRRGPPVKL